MKKFIGLMCFVMFFSFQSVAQEHPLDEGSKVISGTAGISSIKFGAFDTFGSSERSTALSLNPGLQYFVREQISIGGSIGIGANWFRGFQGVSLVLRPEITWYTNEISENLYPFFSGGLSLQSSPFFNENQNVSSNLGSTASVGMIYFFHDYIGLTSQFQFLLPDVTDPGTNAFTVVFGLRYFMF